MRSAIWWCFLLSFLILPGCSGIQSALDPAGREAERIAMLFWWMVGGTAVIWTAVMALGYDCVRARPESFTQRHADLIIIGGGAVVPTVVLAVLLIFGLAMLPGLVAPAPPGSLTIVVDGELWWWRIRYPTSEGQGVSLANEIHLPVNETVEFQLETDNVIHSFWIPALGGKMDMLPGRGTRLALTPTRIGVFRGVCAEYCGDSHALMTFDVVVESRANFDRWLAHQSESAAEPTDELTTRGQQIFLANGCGACHSVRGTRATGVVGPDLTHVGSRLNIAAGTFACEPAQLERWIALTDEVKPGSRMPRFSMLKPDELQAVAAYLKGLK